MEAHFRAYFFPTMACGEVEFSISGHFDNAGPLFEYSMYIIPVRLHGGLGYFDLTKIK